MKGQCSSMLKSDFEYFRAFIFREAGITIDSGKEYLVDTRLLPIAIREGCKDLSTLIAILNKPGIGVSLKNQIVDALTTNETYFFRDIHPFECLRKIILPELIKNRAAEKKLRIWCAASSSGQEPYSIAMLLKEHFAASLLGWDVSILATDISGKILERAKTAMYSQLEVNRGLPAIYLAKYFEKTGLDWKIKSNITSMVRFEKLNLNQPMNVPQPFDLVLMRYVLIYFDTEQKRMVLQQTARNMRKDGYLFLGGAESSIGVTDVFFPVHIDKTVCYKLK